MAAILLVCVVTQISCPRRAASCSAASKGSASPRAARLAGAYKAYGHMSVCFGVQKPRILEWAHHYFTVGQRPEQLLSPAAVKLVGLGSPDGLSAAAVPATSIAIS